MAQQFLVELRQLTGGTVSLAYADFVRAYPVSGVFEAGAGVGHAAADGPPAYRRSGLLGPLELAAGSPAPAPVQVDPRAGAPHDFKFCLPEPTSG